MRFLFLFFIFVSLQTANSQNQFNTSGLSYKNALKNAKSIGREMGWNTKDVDVLLAELNSK